MYPGAYVLAMQRGMLRTINNPEVLDAIVSWIAIDVMNDVVPREMASQMPLHKTARIELTAATSQLNPSAAIRTDVYAAD